MDGSSASGPPLESDPPISTMLTIDGADYDGCTLYVLYDDQGEMMLGSAWPHPLEEIARMDGALLERASTLGLHELDCEPPGRRQDGQ